MGRWGHACVVSAMCGVMAAALGGCFADTSNPKRGDASISPEDDVCPAAAPVPSSDCALGQETICTYPPGRCPTSVDFWCENGRWQYATEFPNCVEPPPCPTTAPTGFCEFYFGPSTCSYACSGGGERVMHCDGMTWVEQTPCTG